MVVKIYLFVFVLVAGGVGYGTVLKSLIL
jgi:hypothetical protein